MEAWLHGVYSKGWSQVAGWVLMGRKKRDDLEEEDGKTLLLLMATEVTCQLDLTFDFGGKGRERDSVFELLRCSRNFTEHLKMNFKSTCQTRNCILLC